MDDDGNERLRTNEETGEQDDDVERCNPPEITDELMPWTNDTNSYSIRAQVRMSLMRLGATASASSSRTPSRGWRRMGIRPWSNFSF